MARLPKGWTKLKVIGDVEPVQVLINRETGKFGTTLDGVAIRQWDTLAEAEAFIKDMLESGAVEALCVDTRYDDAPLRLSRIRVKRVAHGWARLDGTRIPYGDYTLYAPDPTVLAMLDQKHEEYEGLKKQMQRVRDESREILNQLKLLERQ